MHNGLKSDTLAPIDINDYPAIKAHLNEFWAKIEKRSDKGVTPYNLRNCAYMNDFSKPKIVWGEISDKPKFAIDTDGQYYAEATTFFMTGAVSLPYLVCFLNSKLSEYFFSKIGTTTGVGTVRWKKYKVETLPVPVVDSYIMDEFEKILGSLLDYQKQELDYHEWEDAINRKIYKLFSLTDAEIAFIEQAVE